MLVGCHRLPAPHHCEVTPLLDGLRHGLVVGQHVQGDDGVGAGGLSVGEDSAHGEAFDIAAYTTRHWGVVAVQHYWCVKMRFRFDHCAPGMFLKPIFISHQVPEAHPHMLLSEDERKLGLVFKHTQDIMGTDDTCLRRSDFASPFVEHWNVDQSFAQLDAEVGLGSPQHVALAIALEVAKVSAAGQAKQVRLVLQTASHSSQRRGLLVGATGCQIGRKQTNTLGRL